MVAIKSRHVGSGNQDPTWLLDMQNACPVMFGKLAAMAIKRCACTLCYLSVQTSHAHFFPCSNAVNASVTQRSKTQGAANQVRRCSGTPLGSGARPPSTDRRLDRNRVSSQTSRINTRAIGQAAAAQVSAVAVTIAIAKHHARSGAHVLVGNPMATNAANAATLWCVPMDAPEIATEQLFPVTMSSRLVFNANPAKLGSGCILAVAKEIAHAELEDCAISERMGSSSYMLDGLCRAICQPGEYDLDAVWASWVLIVYLSCHPEGRSLLRGTSLTDVDYQTATAFEAYGRAEITRRARLEAAQQQTGGRKRPRNSKSEVHPVPVPLDPTACDFGVLVDQMEDDQREVLGKKRKRGSRGQASASTSDSIGLLQWYVYRVHISRAARVVWPLHTRFVRTQVVRRASMREQRRLDVVDRAQQTGRAQRRDHHARKADRRRCGGGRQPRDSRHFRAERSLQRTGPRAIRRPQGQRDAGRCVLGVERCRVPRYFAHAQ